MTKDWRLDDQVEISNLDPFIYCNLDFLVQSLANAEDQKETYNISIPILD